MKSLPVTTGAQQLSRSHAKKHRPPNALVFVDIYSTRRRSKTWCLTTNQRSGNDSPHFIGINSRRRSLCPRDVETGQADWVLTQRNRIATACELGLQKIVSERAGNLYRSGTSRTWLKSMNLWFA